MLVIAPVLHQRGLIHEVLCTPEGAAVETPRSSPWGAELRVFPGPWPRPRRRRGRGWLRRRGPTRGPRASRELFVPGRRRRLGGALVAIGGEIHRLLRPPTLGGAGPARWGAALVRFAPAALSRCLLGLPRPPLTLHANHPLGLHFVALLALVREMSSQALAFPALVAFVRVGRRPAKGRALSRGRCERATRAVRGWRHTVVGGRAVRECR